jgi:type I restriction enzyme S subunit
MGSEWPILTLREAGVLLIDCEHRTPPAVESGYPYVAIPQMKNGRLDFSEARRISQRDFAEWTRKALPQGYDVVLSRLQSRRDCIC